MLFESYEVAQERMEDYRREAEKYRRSATARNRQREEEQRQHAKTVMAFVHEIIDRLNWRPHEIARG